MNSPSKYFRILPVENKKHFIELCRKFPCKLRSLVKNDEKLDWNFISASFEHSVFDEDSQHSCCQAHRSSVVPTNKAKNKSDGKLRCFHSFASATFPLLWQLSLKFNLKSQCVLLSCFSTAESEKKAKEGEHVYDKIKLSFSNSRLFFLLPLSTVQSFLFFFSPRENFCETTRKSP